MKIVLRLFAAVREMASENEIELELPDTSTVADLRLALIERVPEVEALQAQLRFAVNSAYATDETVISSNDELACIPPVSGG